MELVVGKKIAIPIYGEDGFRKISFVQMQEKRGVRKFRPEELVKSRKILP